MIVIGCTFNPLQLLQALEVNDIRYAVDRVTLNRDTIIFTSILEFAKRIRQVRYKRVVVFDALERLQTIEDIKINTCDDAERVCNYLLAHATLGPPKLPVVRAVNPVAHFIVKNKVGVFQDYNTMFYDIPKKSVRDDVKAFVLKYMQGIVEIEHIDNLLQQTQDTMRQSKMRDAMSLFFVLLKSEAFVTLRAATITLCARRGNVDRDGIDAVASQYGVEPYDLRYFFSVIQKQKGNGHV